MKTLFLICTLILALPVFANGGRMGVSDPAMEKQMQERQNQDAGLSGTGAAVQRSDAPAGTDLDEENVMQEEEDIRMPDGAEVDYEEREAIEEDEMDANDQ